MIEHASTKDNECINRLCCSYTKEILLLASWFERETIRQRYVYNILAATLVRQTLHRLHVWPHTTDEIWIL